MFMASKMSQVKRHTQIAYRLSQDQGPDLQKNLRENPKFSESFF